MQKQKSYKRHRHTRVAILLLLVLVLLLAASPAAFAADVEQQYGSSQPLKDGRLDIQLFRENQNLLAPKNSVSYWFVVPPGISVDGRCTITLHMTATLTLIEELSFAIISINDTQIASRGLISDNPLTASQLYAMDADAYQQIANPYGELEDCYEITWIISFDADLLREEGSGNELKITTVQRSIEGECADIDNPANWVIVHKDSFLSLNIAYDSRPLIKDFFTTYYDSFSINSFAVDTDFVLADLNDSEQVSAMLNIANAVGMNYRYREYIFFDVYAEGGYGNDYSSKIFLSVAQPDAAAAEGDSADNASAAGESTSEPGLQAHLSINGISSRQPYFTFHVDAADNASLANAANLFNNRAVLNLLEVSEMTLESKVQPDSSTKAIAYKESGKYTLKEYGYNSITLANVFHQSTSLSFEQPNGIMASAGSYLEIHFKHSVALLSDRSTMSLKINGEHVSSVKLTPSNADGGVLLAEIPLSALASPVIEVVLEVYHYLGPVDCIKDYYDVAWTAIDCEASFIYFAESSNALNLTLRSFPYFNGADGDVVSLFVPDELSAELQESIAMLAARSGQNTGMAFTWDVINSSLAETSGHIVLLADKNNAENIIPAAVADELLVSAAGGKFVLSEELSLIAESLNNKAVIQVIRSPWDFYKKIYVVLYDGEAGLQALHGLLQTRSNLIATDDQLSVVGISGKVITNIQSKAAAGDESGGAVKIPLTFELLVRKIEGFTNMSIWLLLVILLAVVILLITVIRLSRGRKDKNEYKAMGDAHKASQGYLKTDAQAAPSAAAPDEGEEADEADKAEEDAEVEEADETAEAEAGEE